MYVFAGGAPIYFTDPSICQARSYTVVDYSAVDNAGTGSWSRLRVTPADGTFIRVHQDGAVYRVVGGAPIYISTWTALNPNGSPSPSVDVDRAAVDHAASGGPYNHLNYYPADGTRIAGSPSGARYTVTGRRAVPDTSGVPVPATNTVDQYAINHAGEAGPLSHLIR